MFHLSRLSFAFLARFPALEKLVLNKFVTVDGLAQLTACAPRLKLLRARLEPELLLALLEDRSILPELETLDLVGYEPPNAPAYAKQRQGRPWLQLTLPVG